MEADNSRGEGVADGDGVQIRLNLFFAEGKNLEWHLEGYPSTTVGECLDSVHSEVLGNMVQDIPAGTQFYAYPSNSVTRLESNQPIPADFYLRLVAKGLEKASRLYEGKAEQILATPSPAFIRQEAGNFSILDNLLELIDNAISATYCEEGSQRYKPLVTVMLKEDSRPEDATLVIEDNGHGMSEEVLKKILISSFSHSAGPPVLGRTRLPLPLERYINRHFNRYGRGLHALFFFGDHVVVDSKVPGAVQGHQLEADYQDWKESHAKQCAGQEDKFPYRCYIRKRHDFRTVSSRGQSGGETQVKISRLRPEILSLLCDREVQKFLQKQIASAYYMHLHGFEKPLFERLPSWVRQSSICPRPTVTIKMLDMRMGRDVNAEPFQNDNDAKPPILKMASTRASLYSKHRRMKPFVLCVRYEPKELLGKAASGEGLVLDEQEQEKIKRLAARGAASVVYDLEEDAVIQQQRQDDVEEHWKAVAKAVTHGESPHPSARSTAHTPHGGRGGGRRGGVSGGRPSVSSPPGASSSQATPASVGGRSGGRKSATRGGRGSGSGLRQGGRGAGRGGGEDGPGENQQEEQMEHRGPLGEIDHEKKAPPAYVDFACILDYMLDSTSQLGAITCWSGRVLQDERGKNKLPDFVEAARKMGKQQSVNFYNRLDAGRIAGLLMVSPECKAAMHKTNLDTDPAYLAMLRLGSSLINEDEDKVPEVLRAGNINVFNCFTGQFEQDNNGILAASMLLHHFCSCWAPLDDWGTLEGAVMQEEESGAWVTHAEAWKPPASMKDEKERALEPIKKGELVRVTKTGGTDDVQTGKGDASAYPYNFFVVQEFTQTGGDQPLVHLKQWRPSWSVKEGPGVQQARLSVLRIRPLGSEAKERQAATQKLAKKFESEAPHHLAFRKNATQILGTTNPQEAASLEDNSTFNSPHSFNEVQLIIASKDDKPAKDAHSKFKSIRLESKEFDRKTKAQDSFHLSVSAVLHCDGKEVWRSGIDTRHDVTFAASGFKGACQVDGDYTLQISASDSMGIMDQKQVPLRYNFTVVSAQEPPRLEAAWQEAQAQGDTWATAIAGGTLPPLLLSYMRGNRVMAMPNSTDPAALLSTLKLLLELHRQAQDSDEEEEEEEGEQDGGGGQGAAAKRGRSSRSKATQLRLNRATVENQGGPMLLTNVEVPPKLLVMSGGKVARLDWKLFVTLDKQQEASTSRGSSHASQLCAPPLMLSVTSGPPSQLAPSMGQLSEQGISRGFFAPEMFVKLVDAHGAPWSNPKAGKSKQGKAGSKAAGKAAKDKGKDKVQLPKKPYAMFTLHKCHDKMASGSDGPDILYFDEEGEAKLEYHRLVVDGPASTSAHVTFKVTSESLLNLAILPRPLEHTFTIPISKEHITFQHPEVMEFSKRAARSEGPDANQKAHDAAGVPIHNGVEVYILDMLPYAKDLQEKQGIAQGTRYQQNLPSPETWAVHKEVQDGLKAHAPEIMVRPDGTVYRGSNFKRDACQDLAIAQSRRIYQPVIIVGPRCTKVKDIRVSITDYMTDGLDETFCAPFKVLIDGEHDAYPGKIVGSSRTGDMREKQPQDGYKLPPLELGTVIEAMQSRSEQPILHTMPIKVVDEADNRIVYGEFYVRQTPQPVALALLPIGPAFQAAIAAAATEARGLEVTLRTAGSKMKPEVIAASTQDGPGGSGGKRGRGGASVNEDSSRSGPSGSSSSRSTGAAQNTKQGWLSVPPAVAAAAAAGSTGIRGAAGAQGPGGSSDAVEPLPVVSGWAVSDKPPAAPRPTKINWWHDRVLLDSLLEVRAKVPFQLHFMLLDQLDIPIRASVHAQHHITTTATTSLKPTGAKRTMSAEIVGGWQWNQEDKGGPPFHSVMVQVSGVGAGQLHLQSEDVRVVEGATCSATLLLSLPVLVSSGPVAAHGMQLSSPTPLCTISSLAATHVGDAQPSSEAGAAEDEDTGAAAANTRRGSKRRRGSVAEEEAMDVDRPGQASTSAAAAAAAAGAEEGAPHGVFSIQGLLSCCANPAALLQLQGQAAKRACEQQLRALLPGLQNQPGARGMVMHANDGGSVEVAISLHDENGCPVSQDGRLEVVPLEGWIPDLEIERTQSVVPGASRSNSRILQCRRGQTNFNLKVPQSLAACTQDSLPQRLLIKPCAPYESALPMVMEFVLSPGDYPTHLALTSAPELDSQWAGEPLVFKLSNLSGQNESFMPKLQVEVHNGSGDAVPLNKLGPVKASLRCCWLQRLTTMEPAQQQQQQQQGHEQYEHSQPHLGAQGRVVWVEELPPLDTQDSPQGNNAQSSPQRVVWREVCNEGWCTQPGRPRWKPGTSVAVWEEGALPVPRQADAFRLAVCAADLPIILTHFVEVEPALPHHVACVNTVGQQGQHLRSLPSLPLDVEGRNLQVVTRAQLTPHTLRTPRVTITAKDVHSNTVNLPVGTMFDMLVVQKEQQEQEQQQQLEWVVERITKQAIKAGPGSPDEGAEVEGPFQAHFAHIDLTALPEKAQQHVQGSTDSTPLALQDGCKYALRVCSRLPEGDLAHRCAQEAAHAVFGATQQPNPSTVAAGDMHGPSGAAYDDDGCWVLQTLTLCSFVVASAEDADLRRREQELQGLLSAHKADIDKAEQEHRTAQKAAEDAVAVARAAAGQLHHVQEQVARTQRLTAPAAAAAAPGSSGNSNQGSLQQLTNALLQKLEARPYGEAPGEATNTRKSSTRHQAAAAAAAAAQGGAGSSRSAAAATAEDEAAGSAWSPAPMLDSELRGPRKMLLTEVETMKQNVPSATTILGPVANLMMCEREDVAYALSSFLGNKLLCYVTIKEADSTALFNYLKEHYGKCQVLSLEAARVHPELVDHSHLQQPLKIVPQQGVEQALNTDRSGMQFGFVGFAANLVHLPPALLQKPMISGGGGGKGASRHALYLREILCTYFFQKIMVFENSEGWQAFQAALKRLGHRLEPQTKLLGLDGTRCNMSSGMLEADSSRGKDSRAAGLPICLGGVPLEAQKQAPLDVRVQRVVRSMKELQDVAAKQQAALSARAAAEASLASAAAAKEGVNHRLQAEVQQAQAELDRVQAELERIKLLKGPAARARVGPAPSAADAGTGAAGPSARAAANPARAQQLQEAQAILGQGLRSNRGGSHAHPGAAGGKRGGQGGGEEGGQGGEGARKQPRRG